MDLLDKEILKFWSALQQFDVDYMLIGGYAVNFHGHQRPAGDLDIWLKDNIENRQNLRRAFAASAMGDYRLLETMQFVPGWTDFQLNNGMRLDILTEVKGLETHSFDECIKIAPVNNIAGIEVPFLHIAHLIANKKAVGRPKDTADIAVLERLSAQFRDPPSFSR